MKYFYLIIVSSIFISSASAQGILDSSETHPYLKLTFYPFLFPKGEYGGSFAVGPSVSVSGEKLEVQIGVLYDLTQYGLGYIPTHASTYTYIEFHEWYLPIVFNYYFKVSKRIKCFPTFGGGLLASKNPFASHGWLFAGGGIFYKASNKIKLSMSIHERLASDGFSQGAFFEIAYRLK